MEQDPAKLQTASNETVISLQVKIELSEYRKLIYIISYTSPLYLIMYFVGIAVITWSGFQHDFGWGFYFFLIFLLYMPISVYRNATSNYDSTKILHEPITYEITSETIASTGTTFSYSIAWNSLYKIKEVNDYFLLFTNKQGAMIIPKRAFAKEEELTIFRSYCGRVK